MPSPRTVTIVSGVASMVKYNNKVLSPFYSSLDHKVVARDVKFPLPLLFSCHLHHHLDDEIIKLASASEVVHCQSSGFFRVLHVMDSLGWLQPGSPKKLVLESPVLKSHTGTLLAAMNRVKHYADADQSPFINYSLDTLCFTPEWKAETLEVLKRGLDAGTVLSVGSQEDGVSDIEGLEDDYFSAVYEKGKHARLWRDNDTGLLEDFIQRP
mmetsp:Transcript_24595/g.48893  ORF Transcript_24595/g.48893 Transcript_24595/m.48893 type:complete len:211 (-) Transcript_24595:38-670(-)